MMKRACGSVYAVALSICLLAACRGGAEEQEPRSVGTTPGAEAVQAIEAQNVLTAIPEPSPPVALIGEAREAAETATARVQEIDSIVSGR